MRLTHFSDKELTDALKNQKKQESEALFEEHDFIANCLKMGLTIQDLKELEYKDVAKIMLSYSDNTKKIKKATQSDWDKLAGRK